MSPAEPQREDQAIVRAGLVQPAGPASRGPEAEEQPRHLHLLEKRARTPRQYWRFWLALLGAAAAALCLGLVGLHALIAQDQFQLDRLQAQVSAAQTSYEKLRLQVAQLEAPARIVSVAESHLGMRQPGSITYLPAPVTSQGTVTARYGDADWPVVKPYLSTVP